MDYFLKVKRASMKVAAQGINLIQNVGHDIGLSASSPVAKKGVDDFSQRFSVICQIFDNLAKLESDVEAEKILQESKVHEHIKEALRYLHAEDRVWHKKSMTVHENASLPFSLCGDDGSGSDIPCIEVFLQRRFMDEVCCRVKHDRPRGCLYLVLAMVTSILRNMRFPLLQHQSIHKCVHQLILDASSISSMYNSIAKSKQPPSREFVLYVKKVDAQLVSLISALWIKISDNPSLLNFFMFIDRRDGVKIHVDVISCLIPLMGKPKIGTIAKEALLTAIRMHDQRIDSFILDETNLRMNVMAELTKKFQGCVTVLASNLNVESVSTGTKRSSVCFAKDDKSMGAIEPFLKVLRFCAAIVAASSDANSHTSVKHNFLKLFSEKFLPCVKNSVLENGEEQVLATQSILERMMSETFYFRCDESANGLKGVENEESILQTSFPKIINPLCFTISSFLSDDEELFHVLFRRVGSVSRCVSVSTIQLLTTLLSTMSASDAQKFVIFSRNNHDTTPHYSAVGLESWFEVLEDVVEPFIQKHIPHRETRQLSNYTDSSLNHILHKLIGNNSEQIATETFSGRHEYGPFFIVGYNKLQSFLSLNYDEQLAVTGLVNKCTIFLVAIIFHNPTQNVIERVFIMLSKLFDTVDNLESEIQRHKANVTQVKEKIELVREVLASPVSSKLQSRKVVESESAQVVRILESSIILEELRHEMEGSVLAMKELLFLSVRSTLFKTDSNVPNIDIVPMPPFIGEDDWSTDGENEHDGNNLINSHDLDVDTFLTECESMEVALDEVLSSLSSPQS